MYLSILLSYTEIPYQTQLFWKCLNVPLYIVHYTEQFCTLNIQLNDVRNMQCTSNWPDQIAIFWNVFFTHRHTDTQTHRHTDTQTHRHTDTQTHRHTDTQTHSFAAMLFGLSRACIWNNSKHVHPIKTVWPIAKMNFSETNNPVKLTVQSLVHKSKSEQGLESCKWSRRQGGRGSDFDQRENHLLTF